jgi:RNA polymerase sigma-54 factor
MELRLSQTQTQKLVLSPLIRQYLRLLQLPVAELRNAIEQELAENPALEELPRETAEESQSARLGDEQGKEERNAKELRFDETLRSLDKLDDGTYDGLYAQGDFSLREPEELRRKKYYQESLITRKESLFDFLTWQIGFLNLSDTERRIAEEIIGNLTDEGYLGTPLEEIAQTCGIELSEAENVLDAVQGLDPPGVGARNLQETLLLQLGRKGPEADLAKRIVSEHLVLLEKKQWDQIAKHCKATGEAIRQAAHVIARLDPKPGRSFYGDDPIAVTPDASVSYDDSDNNKLKIEIYDESLPDLRISPHYRKLLRNPKLDETSRRFLKEKIQSAMDFVKALAQRRSTLGSITEEIVSAQPEFFEKGFSHLRPLRLKDISQSLSIHESTVSRAIQGKYLSTPQGTIPYKSFFSSKLERAEGGAESQKSAMEKVRELIRSEEPSHPLSDQAIARMLQREGLKIARRTVAKYRELLKILPTHLRRNK